MIVADTQLVVYATIRSPNSELAAQVFEKDPAWTAPLLWRSEYRNALLGHMRQQDMSLQRALAACVVAQRMLLGRERLVTATDVLALSVDNRISAYDLEFVVLARQLSVRLVTFDKQVLAAFPGVAVSPEAFVTG